MKLAEWLITPDASCQSRLLIQKFFQARSNSLAKFVVGHRVFEESLQVILRITDRQPLAVINRLGYNPAAAIDVLPQSIGEPKLSSLSRRYLSEYLDYLS
jgi:hypothetical protein